MPRSDRKALSRVSDWVDSTQSLLQINLYQSQIHPGTAMVAGTWLVLEDLSESPWYNLNCTGGGGEFPPPPESSRRLTVRAWVEGLRHAFVFPTLVCVPSFAIFSIQTNVLCLRSSPRTQPRETASAAVPACRQEDDPLLPGPWRASGCRP